MSEWQPISTAPRDGTAICLLVDNQPYIGYCDPADPPLRKKETWLIKASFRRRDRKQRLPDEIYSTYGYDMAPTDWMPLPEPPK